MNFSIDRTQLLTALQSISGVVERKPKLEALTNVLFRIAEDRMVLTTSDTEVELSVTLRHAFQEKAEFLVGARKLLDVCRTLPDDAQLDFQLADSDVHIRSQSSRSNFKLTSYPRDGFALVDTGDPELVFKSKGEALGRLLARTQFSMANQDVRYYLNGLLLVLNADGVAAVATDGHRLAISEEAAPTDLEGEKQIIIPRKGVFELSRILPSVSDEEVEFNVTTNHICLETAGERFTSKLIEGKYPDYGRVIPAESDTPVVVGREDMYNGLARVSTLDPERRKGVEMSLDDGCMRLRCVNSEQEEAQAELDVEYSGAKIKTGFNAQYLLDVLSAIGTSRVVISIKDAESSCLVRGEEEGHARYVIMPLHM